MSDVVLLGSITDLRPEHSGAVVVSGSHGGMFPAAVASRGRVRAVVFNDAGGGLERAGVAGVMALAATGCAAAAVDCMSCRIGSAEDMMATGRLSFVNPVAEQLGLRPGQAVATAVEILGRAPLASDQLATPAEARQSRVLQNGLCVELLDSASMVLPEDAGKIVITGSHGALIGGNPLRALKARARFAVFNDAGVGKDGIGTSRLPALQTQGIAAATVSHSSARIGDAMSALQTGILSATNPEAERLGAQAGQTLLDFMLSMQSTG